MTIIGLTGGIASGKSTVARLFSAMGVPLLDADLVARQVVVPGSRGYSAVRQAFGATLTYADGTSSPLIDAEGEIDRKALGRLVFNDPDKLRLLEQVLQPLIAERVSAQLAVLEKIAPYAIYENALLVEHGTYRDYDALIVVVADRETQKWRLMARNNLTETEAVARIAAQAPVEEKVRAATYVIDNSGNESDLRRQVRDLHIEILHSLST